MITIREAVVADAAAIARIHTDSWQHAYRGILHDAFLARISVSERTVKWTGFLENPRPKTSTFVALNEGFIVGFCRVGASRIEGAAATASELYAIYLDPNHTGKGVGSKLHDAGLDRLRSAGFKSATLWALAENETARSFYERKGWKTDGAVCTDQIDEATFNDMLYSIDL